MKTKRTNYVFPYLPDILINSQVSGTITNKDNIIIDGSLLFADLSGFTAMSEKLSELGRFGGEKLAEIMNGCFNSLLGLTFAAGGDVIKFGGDAFLALFSGEDSAAKGYNCAGNLINWISRNGKISTPVGDFTLDIHAGISKGKIYNLYIGKKRKDHLFCGLAVEKAYAAADAASLGQLAMTGEAVKAIGNIDVYQTDEGFFICRDFSNLNVLKPISRPRTDKNVDNSYLEKFIVTGLNEQLHFNNGVIEGEHRVLTNLFIGVDSLKKNLEIDTDKSISAINNYFDTLNSIITKHGGAFARMDSSGTSEKMLIFFGAPVSSGRDAQNCLKTVLEIESSLPEINKKFIHPIKHRYGINTGLCFVGDVGGRWRREYTAMGDAVNLAARLMSKASFGDILIGEQTIKICGDDFVTHDGGLITVKGKKKPVRIYYLDKQIERDSSTELMIGRDKELEAASKFINKISSKQRSLLLISGEPGAGKSLLCAKTKKMAAKAGLINVEGACFKHSSDTPYGPLKAILLGLLRLPLKSTQKNRRLALQKHLKAINENEWEPLIAPLLDYSLAIPPHIKNLPEDIKKKKISDTLCGLICEINRKHRSLVIIEDVQWIDDASFNIIESISDIEDSPGLIFISRHGKIYDKLKKTVGIESIELGSLTPENSRNLFLTILDDIKPDEKIIDQVIEKSAGNPFYLEEMAKAFRELGPDRFNEAENIPSGIESVITARMDNLGEMVKKTIRTASVIGRVFAYSVLKEIFPDRRRVAKLRNYIQELAHLDLTPLERTQPALEYIFKHVLTQEVAYNGLSFSARKTLHIKTAEYYAGRKRLLKRQPDVPARHYLLAEENSKALPFLFMAGQKAAKEFANSEAFGFYEKVIEISEKNNNKEYLIKALNNRGELAKHTGEFKLAESDYLRLKHLGNDNPSLMAAALRELSLIHRVTAEYGKAETAVSELEKLNPDDTATRVFCLNGHAEIIRRRGKLQACREQLLEALHLCRDNNVPPDLKAIVYNNLGVCHWSLGRMKEASGYYKSALTLYKHLKDLSGQAKITNNLGIINDEMGKLHQAARSYEKAEKIFKRIGASRSEAFACANHGTNLSTRGYLSQATEKLSRAKAIFKKIGDQHSLAYTIGDLGFIYFREGNIETAKKHFTRALEKAYQLKDEEFILDSKIRLARLNLIRGQTQLDEIEELVNNAKNVGSAELEIKAKIIKGMLLLGTDRFKEIEILIANIDNIPEMNDYPELELELAKLRIIFNFICDNKSESLKILKTSLKKAISGDLAMIVIELSVIGEACTVMNEIPAKITRSIQEYFQRLEANMDDAVFRRFRVFHRRNIEVMHNFINGSKNRSKVLEYPHNI